MCALQTKPRHSQERSLVFTVEVSKVLCLKSLAHVNGKDERAFLRMLMLILKSLLEPRQWASSPNPSLGSIYAAPLMQFM